MSDIKFCCPAEGQLIKIEDFPDEIIASKAMGDGFGINLTGDKILAPIDGEIKVMYPTGHAVCLEGADGTQIMIHVGIDSYNIQGLNRVHCKVGDMVKAGDKLITTNVRQLIKKTGNSATAVVFLSGETVELLKENEKVKYLDDTIINVTKGQNND